ncbi:MAG: hypothetical protein GY737_16575 [Desulfobacteraceae bacterium]|nr:hypothetical protein [Desulfobacteraceae bacterium]
MAKIVIDLEGERDAYAVSELNDLVHPKELDQLKEMLKHSVKLAEEYSSSRGKKKSSLISVRRHDTIMLAGVRGSGKTTFMLSALKYIEDGIDGTEFVDGVKSMDIIDPTLIEEKVHIFVNIISMVKEIVNEKAKKQNCFSEDTEFSSRYKKWQISFRKLAEGLPSINGVGTDVFSDEAWLDSEFVMDKGVQRAHAANTLERNFHDYIYHSLKFIGQKAFVLCFDDIDTHFEKGWPVLEVIHKYLTTPQFITILSGDPQLYSILIRQKQWENFSDKLLHMEARSKKERQPLKDTVAHLEEQYFLKILKPERRIFLSSLYQKDKNPDYPIHVKRKDTDDEESLRDCYYELMKEMGIFRSNQRQSCYRFLASLPIRTQKQLLHAFDTAPDEIANSISNIFWSDLSDKNVDVSNLRNAPQHIVPETLDYLVKNEILNEGYTLAPVFSDQLVNGAQFALGSLMTSRIKQEPGLIFDYWIRIALSRELGALWKDQAKKSNGGPSIDNLILHCAMGQGRPARYVARLATSYIRAYRSLTPTRTYRGIKSTGSYSNKSWHGTLPLYGLSQKSNTKDDNKNRIDTVLDEISSKNGLAGIMGRLPLSGVTDHKGYTLPVYSFYNLLGILGELIDTAQKPKEDLTSNEVFTIIQKNAQFREYPVPPWISLGSDVIRNFSGKNIEEEHPEVACKPQDEFIKEIMRWVEEGTGIVVSSSVLGKIFTRFFYTMNSMDHDLSNENRLGVWIHRMLVAFLNAILVVETHEGLAPKAVSLSLLNPVISDKTFIDNLKKINNLEIKTVPENLRLSKWILSCPIWPFYLKKEISELEQFVFPKPNNTKPITEEQARATNRKKWNGALHNDLNKVLIRGQGAPRIRNKTHRADLTKTAKETNRDANQIKKAKEIIKETAQDKTLKDRIKKTEPIKPTDEIIKETKQGKALDEVTKEMLPFKTLDEFTKEMLPFKTLDEFTKEMLPFKTLDEIIKETEQSKTLKKTFTVTDDKHLKAAIKIFKIAGKTPQNILDEDAETVKQLMKRELSSEYYVKHININTIGAIHKRIKNGKLKW